MGQLAEFATSHPLYVLGLLAAWAAVMFYELRLKSQSLSQVSAVDAVRLINRGAQVVDVRAAEAYHGGHIVGARNVDLAQLEADQQLLGKQKSKLLIMVCDNGASAAKAASLLRKAGHEKVFSLKGGINGWRGQNLPLVK
jgi:rhodanese-related sulfurtransferase